MPVSVEERRYKPRGSAREGTSTERERERRKRVHKEGVGKGVERKGSKYR